MVKESGPIIGLGRVPKTCATLFSTNSTAYSQKFCNPPGTPGFAFFAAQENIQTHGGIGFTWEADTQFYYRRSQVLGLSLGSIASWKNKLVTQLEEKNN